MNPTLTNFKKISLVAIGLLALIGCQDKIELDLPEGEKFLVVEGWITNEARPHEIILTTTAPYFDQSPVPRVSGATVILRDDQDMETTLTEQGEGVYIYPDSGTVGRSYQLEIFTPDGEHYLSDFELLREPVPIFDISWQLSEKEPDPDFDQQPDDIYDVLITTTEPPGEGDCYRWRVILNGREQNEPWDILITNDDLVDGNFIPELNVTEELYSSPDTVVIIQERISQVAFDFLNQVLIQTAYVGGPFDTPPAPIKGNVHNVNDPTHDALGFFGAAARDDASVIVGVE